MPRRTIEIRLSGFTAGDVTYVDVASRSDYLHAMAEREFQLMDEQETEERTGAPEWYEEEE